MYVCIYIYMYVSFCICMLKTESLLVSQFLFSTQSLFQLYLFYIYNFQLSSVYHLFGQSLVCNRCLNPHSHWLGWDQPLTSAPALQCLQSLESLAGPND